MKNPNQEYSNLAKCIHWLMAVLFLFMWVSGYYMITFAEKDSNLQELLFDLHISVGVTLLFLLFLRLIVRYFTPPPAALSSLSKLEKIGSHFGHIMLYLLPALTIFIGWAGADFGGHGVTWFGIEMVKMFPTMEYFAGINLDETKEILHKWLAYLILLLTVIHIVAVIKHRIEGHDVLFRMTFGRLK